MLQDLFPNLYWALVARAIRFIKNRRGIVDPPIEIRKTPQNTLEIVAGLEDFSITITEPAMFAGTYEIKLEDLAKGGDIELVAPDQNHNGLYLTRT